MAFLDDVCSESAENVRSAADHFPCFGIVPCGRETALFVDCLMILKFRLLVKVPPGAVTVTKPVVAPDGTTAVI